LILISILHKTIINILYFYKSRLYFSDLSIIIMIIIQILRIIKEIEYESEIINIKRKNTNSFDI
jgi:hypothetical protein